MATTEAPATTRRYSMAPTTAGGTVVTPAVPVGAAPIVPAFVPPAQVYEEDEDEVEEVMKPQRQIAQQAGASKGSDMMCALCTAMVIMILAVATTFYVINTNKPITERTTVYTTAKTHGPKQVFVGNETDVDVAGRAKPEEGPGDVTRNDEEASLTQSI
ncbi:hypothetical protein HPB50_029406 [Hyalomma asiaticum]|nr:hypothetical protein HPB50_029406 [Hyalomma asiaticum]